MLGSELPLGAEEKDVRSVSPLGSHHVSRSSTPGISFFDGTPRYLCTSPPPPRPHSSPASLDMAIKPARHADTDCDGHYAKVKRARMDLSDPEPLPSSPPSGSIEQDATSPALHVPSLSNLARSLKQKKYQTRRCHHLQAELRSVQIASARISRQLHTARSVQRTLAECIKSEDKASFLSLFNAFHDSLQDCLVLPDFERSEEEEEEDSAKDPIGSHATFLDGVSSQSRSLVLDVLGKVRHDGNFIADALIFLTHKELLSLLPSRNPHSSGESVFGATPWTTSRTSRHLGYVVDSQTELLSTMTYGSPLEMLVHCTRGFSGPPKCEDQRSVDVWSTVCSRLLVEQKPGSEKFVPAVLDVWAASADWPGKGRLELWLLETLQNASFLTEQPAKQSFRVRVQARQEAPAEDHLRAETFYSQAINSLFDLLADQTGTSVIPQSVIQISQAIWRKLQHSAGHQQGFTHFVVTRWLFSPFFFDVLTSPEAFGLLLDCYISDITRHRVLREIASRAQRIIFDVAYSWKHGNYVPIETASRIQAIMDRFGDHGSSSELASLPTRSGARSLGCPDEIVHLAVSATDVVGLVNALFPQRRPASFSSDRDALQSGLQSSASSVSGFSLFRSHPLTNLPVSDAAPWVQEPVLTGLPDATLDVPSGLLWNGSQPTTSASVDASHIREACAELEDMVNAIASDDAERWVALETTPYEPRVHAAQDTSFRDLACAGDQLQPTGPTTNLESWVMTVEDLLTNSLNEDCLDYEHAGLSHASTLAMIHEQLLVVFEDHIFAARARSDFLGELSWFQEMRDFRALTCGSEGLENVLTMLNDIEGRVKAALMHTEHVIGLCESRLDTLKPQLDHYWKEALKVTGFLGQMRDKMWYVADVRTSAAYDEARSIAGALKVMGIPKKPARTRLAPPLRHWSGSKLSSTSLHLKTEAQILELLSTAPEQGGPNKLSDDQSRATASWMERNNIENLCRGEERLHKLCMEIRKCTDQLMASDGAMVWANPLFAHEKDSVTEQRTSPSSATLSVLQATSGRFRQLSLQTNMTPSIDAVSSASHPLSTASSRDFLEARSPTLTNKSSMPFWSPAVTDAQSPSSATSIGSIHMRGPPVTSGRRRAHPSNSGTDLLTKLKACLTSLLLSDLGASLFSDGSETDKAFWTGLGGELTDRHIRSEHKDCNITGQLRERERERDPDDLSSTVVTTFDFAHACGRLLRLFSASSDPSVKLGLLHDIDRLLAVQAGSTRCPRPMHVRDAAAEQSTSSTTAVLSRAESCVEGFRKLFSDITVRPRAVFRDLQYIAALVPATILENTVQGKAFWNAAVAISGIKQGARITMVETADSIIAYHSNNRGHGRSSSTAQQQRDSATFTTPNRTPSAEDVGRYSMADAAYLLQITAKEGDATAQRELATLYLTHPELMDHIIAPFARPKEVFKDELESKWRKNQDPARCDPTTMCVAHHWMSLSSKGGDALAKEFLRQREEMERLP